MTDCSRDLVRRADASSGNEEAGQEVDAGGAPRSRLEPVDVPMDADALRAHPAHSPFDWDVSRQARTSSRPGGPARRPRPVADPQRPRRRREPRAASPVGPRPLRGRPRGRLALRARRRRHEVRARGDPRRRRAGCGRSRPHAARAGAPRVRRRGGVHGQRHARAACWPATRPMPPSSPSRSAPRSRPRRSVSCGSSVKIKGVPGHAAEGGNAVNAIEKSLTRDPGAPTVWRTS